MTSLFGLKSVFECLLEEYSDLREALNCIGSDDLKQGPHQTCPRERTLQLTLKRLH